MISLSVSRRAFLASTAAAVGCGPKKATGFPGYCFVANRDSRSITAVDLNRFQVRKQIPLDAAPSAILARQDASRPRAFALAPHAGAIYEVSPETLAVSRKASVGRQLAAMRFTPDGRALWVLSRDPAALVRVPLDSFRPSQRIPLPGPPEAFDITEDGRLLAASLVDGRLALASVASNSVERVIPCSPPAPLVLFRKDGKQLLAGSPAERNLTVYDVATGASIVKLPLPMAPRHFCVTEDGGQLFITGDGVDAVAIAFPYVTEVEQTILAGHAPGSMTVTPAYLLVTNPQSGSITVIDVDTRRLVAVVQVGQGLGRVIITPDGQYALALNERSGQLAVIRLSTFADARVRRYKSAPLFTMVPVGSGPTGAAVLAFGG